MMHVSQKLYEERLKRGLSLEEVSKATKIRVAFLSAIENGEYQKLPSSAYAFGFVRNYAEFLGLPKKEILALFKREFDVKKVFKVLPEGLIREEEFSIQKIKLQGIPIILFLFFLCILAYLIFQYRYAIINPPLEVFFPIENSTVALREIIVSGKTDLNSTVYVNNSAVSLDKEGFFKKNIDLFPGKKTITIKAVNRFGKETVIEKHIDVKSE